MITAEEFKSWKVWIFVGEKHQMKKVVTSAVSRSWKAPNNLELSEMWFRLFRFPHSVVQQEFLWSYADPKHSWKQIDQDHLGELRNMLGAYYVIVWTHFLMLLLRKPENQQEESDIVSGIDLISAKSGV